MGTDLTCRERMGHLLPDGVAIEPGGPYAAVMAAVAASPIRPALSSTRTQLETVRANAAVSLVSGAL